MKRQLIDALAADGDDLRDAAAAIGGRIRFDPREALSRDPALNLQQPTRWSPNRHCRLIEAKDGWLAVNLPREEDRYTVPAWVRCAPGRDPWRDAMKAAGHRRANCLAADAVELHLPVSRVGETAARRQVIPAAVARRRGDRRRLAALDLSALWAGPYCGALLAEAGIAVTRIDSPTRPDPTSRSAPMLDHRLNGAKRRITLAIDDDETARLLAQTDILITSSRPHALARLGLTEARLFAINPELIWVAVTAHGWRGADGLRVGFGDDCAAAGGLLTWRDGKPRFLGDALADPLTGIAAANIVLRMLAAGKGGLIDAALAQEAVRMAGRLGLV